MKNNIKYISTRGQSEELGFKDVIFEGLASDGGLYIPNEWPTIDEKTLSRFTRGHFEYRIIGCQNRTF